jgi:hypothetical protein
LIIRRLIVPLTVGVISLFAGQCFAQGAFPAPLPGQQQQRPDPAFPPVNGSDPAFPPVNNARPSPFPPVNGAAAPSSFPVTGAAPIAGANFERGPAPPQGGPPDSCGKGFLALRDEAEKRGKILKAASVRHAGPDEACKLIGNYSQVEVKMISYVETNSAKCGIPSQIADQIKAAHKNTEGMQKRICEAAQQQQQQQKGAAGPSLSEVLGSAAELPDAKAAKRSGGSTFDTLNGNVLSR